MRRSVHGFTIWLIVACGAGQASSLSAQDSSLAGGAGDASILRSRAPGRASTQNDSAALRTAERSAAAGVFLRLTESPTTSSHRVAVGSHGGYDGRRQGALFDMRGEVVLLSRAGLERRSAIGLSLLGGGLYAAGSPGVSEAASGRVGVKVQPVFQEQLGFDAALSVTYESRGFNTVPAVSTELLLARRMGDTQLLLNAGYGAGLRESERFGRLRAAILVPLVAQLHLGLEARGQLDLERDENEPTGETDYECAASAFVSYTISHFALSAGVGPGAIRYRNGLDTQVGVVATVGIGAAL